MQLLYNSSNVEFHNIKLSCHYQSVKFKLCRCVLTLVSLWCQLGRTQLHYCVSALDHAQNMSSYFITNCLSCRLRGGILKWDRNAFWVREMNCRHVLQKSSCIRMNRYGYAVCVCMYVCMVWMYACMCVCMYVCMYGVYVCVYLCMYVCVCMYVCIYVLSVQRKKVNDTPRYRPYYGGIFTFNASICSEVFESF